MARKLQKYLTQDDVHATLKAIEQRTSDFDNADRARDFIFLGFYLGLRVSEACLLRREHLDSRDRIAAIPTLKQSKKLKHVCPKCGREFRLAERRGGKRWNCTNCDKVSTIAKPAKKSTGLVPLIELPFVEDFVWDYIGDLQEGMRKDQEYYLESRPGRPATRFELYNDFKRALFVAGLPSYLAPHSLRHGRGQHVWALTNDLKAVQACLRHQSAQTASIYAHLANVDTYLKRLNEGAWTGDRA